MSDPNELLRAFNNMKLYTQDHMILSMRPELRKGVLEAIQIFEKEIIRLKTERVELERKLGQFNFHLIYYLHLVPQVEGIYCLNLELFFILFRNYQKRYLYTKRPQPESCCM